MRRVLSGSRALAVMAIAIACLGGLHGPGNAPAADAEDSEEQLSLARGKTIYDRRCAVCHGPQGKGDGPEAPFLSPRPASLLSAATSVKADTELLRIIENGKPRTAMPAWKDSLTETERHDVLAYIRSLIRFQKSVTPPPPPADVNR